MTPNSNILLTNIQRFSLHDGPGIRTTVFLKGCSIHCPWCSNPENLSHAVQNYIKKDKNGKIEEEGIYGKWYTDEALYAEVIKDKAFYGSCGASGGTGDTESVTGGHPSSDGACSSASAAPDSANYLDSLPGGVTFSGGECMLQMKELEPLLERLNAEGTDDPVHIHTAVETSLFCSPSQLSIAIAHIDLFYIDVKIMGEEMCKDVLGGKIEIYKENLKRVLNSGKPVVLRLPVIGGYTDGEENRRDVIELIKSYASCPNLLKVEILKEHNLGTNKYQSLIHGGNAIHIPEYRGVDDSLMETYKGEIVEGLREAGSAIPVEICKI